MHCYCRWSVIGLLWLLSLTSWCRAQSALELQDGTQTYNPSPQVQYLIDDSARLTVDTLPTDPAAWQVLGREAMNLGYVSAPVWLKWQVRRADAQPRDWYLVVHYAMLDHLEFYVGAPGSGPGQALLLGDHYPFGARLLQHPEFIAPFHLGSTGVHDLYLRVESKGSLQVPMTLVTPDTFWQRDRVFAILEAGSYFICLIMAVYNFMLFLFLRDRSYLFYVSYIVFFAIGLATNRGWSFQFLWPDRPWLQDVGIVYCSLLALASACAFATSFMRLSQLAPRWHGVVSLMALTGLFLALVSPTLDYHLSIKIMVGFALVCSLGLALIASTVWYRTRSRQAALYCISWLFLLAGISIYMGNKFGILPVNFLTNEGLRLGALFEIVFLSFALADRVNQDRAAREAAQQQVIDLQVSMNSELEKQVKVRTQELEYLNELLRQASITDGLTGIANRRHFDDMLNREFRRAIRDGSTLALLMVDLDFFKRINDSHGHPVGDLCLKEVARILMESVRRPPDMVARYGGEEFVVLLPNTPASGAAVVAEKILERVRGLLITTPEGVVLRLTASIGLAACQPGQGDECPRLVLAADTALYEAKQGGRDRLMMASDLRCVPVSA